MTAPLDSGYIGPGLVLRGRLSGRGDLVIAGRLAGEIAVEGSVSIGPEGHVDASIEVGSLTVEGVVRGGVKATSSVAVREGGRIEGDVRAPSVAIDDGGVLHGGVEMDFELPGEAAEGEP